jgi:hypothetical protein
VVLLPTTLSYNHELCAIKVKLTSFCKVSTPTTITNLAEEEASASRLTKSTRCSTILKRSPRTPISCSIISTLTMKTTTALKVGSECRPVACDLDESSKKDRSSQLLPNTGTSSRETTPTRARQQTRSTRRTATEAAATAETPRMNTKQGRRWRNI